MRKIFFLIALCPLLLININNDFHDSQAVDMNGFSVHYSSNVVEPMEPKSSATIRGNINIVLGPSKYNLRIRYDLYSPLKSGMDKSYKSAFLSDTFAFPFRRNFDYEFTITDKTDLAREGITVRVGVYDTSNNVYINHIDGHLYDRIDDELNIDSLRGTVTYDRCLYLSDTKATESFNFSNYFHVVEVKNYYRLNLSSLSFTYYSFKDLTYENAYITFKDDYDLFPYVNTENGEKKVPIKLNYSNNNVSIGFDSLYVDSDSLMMSTSEKAGFSRTNYFYLPKNKLNKLQGLPIKVHVHKLGAHRLSYTYGCSINFSLYLLGPCNLSEFCIVGGVEK